MALDANGHPVSRIAQRKLEHLRLSLEASVQSTRSAGFERFAFSHEALPELDLDAVDLTTSFLGKPLKLPFLISSMTGGAHAAGDINRRLALVAQSVGIAFGVGSQRAGITHKDLRATYQVRGVAPDVLLFANLGAVQLNYGMHKEQALEAIEMIGADALVLHLNPLQEALQPEGDHNFMGLIEKIATLCRELPVPVIVKEVGCGISARTAGLLASAGVAAIDVAGLGGTSFARVEAFRRERPEEVELALAFSEWGIPTVEALIATHRAAPGLPLIASDRLQAMNQALDRELSRLSQRVGSSQSSLLTEMVQYHLGLRKAGERPGKRLRANMALLTCEAFGKRYADALWAAVAVELAHNFSLVFDDVQDGDELRRGRPSVWKVWGQGQAINAGAALEALVTRAVVDLLPARYAERTRPALLLLTESMLALCRGQVLDLQFEQRVDV